MTAGMPTTEQVVTDALASMPGVTAADLAAPTALGRSTIERRLPSSRAPAQFSEARAGGRRLPDRWTLTSEVSQPRREAERLRPGELDGLVLDYLRRHATEGPLGLSAVAKGLERSSGAVGNCPGRLAAAGRVQQVSERPRRYILA
jgi:hypothetical protein